MLQLELLQVCKVVVTCRHLDEYSTMYVKQLVIFPTSALTGLGCKWLDVY